MISENLSDYLELWGLEENILVFNDGSLGAGFSIKPLDIDTFTDDRVNEITGRVRSFLNSLPSGLNFQFQYEIGKTDESEIKSFKNLQSDDTQDVIKKVTEMKCQKLLKENKEDELPDFKIKVFVRKEMSCLESSKKSKRKKKLYPKLTSENIDSEIKLFTEWLSEFEVGLKSIGVGAEILKGSQILDLTYAQWNPTRGIELDKAFDHYDVRDSLLFEDVAPYKRGFEIGSQHFKVVSLKLMPQMTFSGLALRLRSMPFKAKCYLGVYVPDQQSEINYLQMQRRLAFSMVTGKTTGVSDIESQSKLDDLEDLLHEMIAGGEKVFQTSFNVVVSGEAEAEAEKKASEVLMAIRELNGAEGMTESYAAFDLFKTIAVPNAKPSERLKRLKTSNMADLIPLFAPWKGHRLPRNLLKSRDGSLVKFDPFSESLTNYNQIISGGSGAGKSFLCNLLMTSAMKENPKIFFIDIGGSYKKTCENLDGQYTPIDLKSKDILSINPFDYVGMEKGLKVPDEKIKFIVSLVEMMVKEDHEKHLPKLIRSTLEDGVRRLYQERRKPLLRDLKNLLLNHDHSEMRQIGQILKSWCGDAPYGKLFDRESRIDFKKNVISFDLKGLESYPDLQAVTLFIITDLVWREVQKDKTSMKYVIFDECWKFLQSEGGVEFIAELYRTLRKYNASAIAISQNIDDFARSKASTAIMPNSSVKWILKQKGADFERLKSVLALNDYEIDLIKSLYQKKGYYSEAFLISESDKMVVRVESTPLEYWLATTDPKDLAKIEEVSKSHPDKAASIIIEELSELYPKGMSGEGA